MFVHPLQPRVLPSMPRFGAGTSKSAEQPNTKQADTIYVSTSKSTEQPNTEKANTEQTDTIYVRTSTDSDRTVEEDWSNPKTFKAHPQNRRAEAFRKDHTFAVVRAAGNVAPHKQRNLFNHLKSGLTIEKAMEKTGLLQSKIEALIAAWKK